MRNLELLQEIDAWLSFNNTPSKEQISELRNDIKKHISEQLTIHDVSNRRKLYFAFMKEYNSLMGESEHQILKEEVEVLLAGQII